jgi:hypothetical protein
VAAVDVIVHKHRPMAHHTVVGRWALLPEEIHVRIAHYCTFGDRFGALRYRRFVLVQARAQRLAAREEELRAAEALRVAAYESVYRAMLHEMHDDISLERLVDYLQDLPWQSPHRPPHRAVHVAELCVFCGREEASGEPKLSWILMHSTWRDALQLNGAAYRCIEDRCLLRHLDACAGNPLVSELRDNDESIERRLARLGFRVDRPSPQNDERRASVAWQLQAACFSSKKLLAAVSMALETAAYRLRCAPVPLRLLHDCQLRPHDDGHCRCVDPDDALPLWRALEAHAAATTTTLDAVTRAYIARFGARTAVYCFWKDFMQTRADALVLYAYSVEIDVMSLDSLCNILETEVFVAALYNMEPPLRDLNADPALRHIQFFDLDTHDLE